MIYWLFNDPPDLGRHVRRNSVDIPCGRKIAAALTVVLLAAALAGPSGCDRKEKPAAADGAEPLALGVGSWPASAPIFVALDKGYFRDEALAVTVHPYSSGHQALEAALTGKDDLATAADTPIARAALHGEPLAVVATIAEIDRGTQIIARKDSGISGAEGLRGKRVGLAKGSSAEFFLHLYLTTSYVDPNDVRIVDTPAETVGDALLNGEVDAVSTWAPYTSRLRQQLGDNAMVLDDPVLYTMTWNLVAARDFAGSHLQRIVKLLRAVVRANRFIADRPAEAAAIVARHIGMDAAMLERDWPDFRFIAALEQRMIVDLEAQARWMLRGSGQTAHAPPNFAELMYVDGLKVVSPEAVRIAGQ